MERVSISRLKDQLSAYLKKVQAGETVLVMDRTAPAAQVTPLPPSVDESGKIAGFGAGGVLWPPQGPPLSLEELQRLRVKAPGARLLEALLEDRREGR